MSSRNPTPEEPNNLTAEQNELLNAQVDVLLDALAQNAPILAGRLLHIRKTFLVAVILFAYVTDEEWLQANTAAQAMIDAGYSGSIKNAVDLYMPKRVHREAARENASKRICKN